MVYVYRLDEGVWTLEQALAPATFNFASPVAIDGDTIALGMESPTGLGSRQLNDTPPTPPGPGRDRRRR